MADERNDIKKILEKIDSLDKKLEEIKPSLKTSFYWSMMAYSISIVALGVTAHSGMPDNPYVACISIILMILGFVLLGVFSLIYAISYTHNISNILVSLALMLVCISLVYAFISMLKSQTFLKKT